jgi:hypothetical protein
MTARRVKLQTFRERVTHSKRRPESRGAAHGGDFDETTLAVLRVKTLGGRVRAYQLHLIAKKRSCIGIRHSPNATCDGRVAEQTERAMKRDRCRRPEPSLAKGEGKYKGRKVLELSSSVELPSPYLRR